MAGGDLHVKPNKFIENWAARREAVEFGFRWTPKSLLTLGIVGVAIPGAVYYAMCHEFVRSAFSITSHAPVSMCVCVFVIFSPAAIAGRVNTGKGVVERFLSSAGDWTCRKELRPGGGRCRVCPLPLLCWSPSRLC